MNSAHCGMNGPAAEQREEDRADEERGAVAAQIFLGSARLKRPRGRKASTIAITK